MMHSKDELNKSVNFELPKPVLQFITLCLALTTLCLIIELFCSIRKLPYPYDWPLMPKGDPFRDFYLYKPRYAFFHSEAFFSFDGPAYMYPATLAVIYRLFYFFRNSTGVFLGFLCTSFLGGACVLARALLARGVSWIQIVLLLQVSFLCSYPFFFEFEQANMEVFVWVLVAFGICLFLRGNGYSSATCFGIAVSMKIFPLVFLGLFLARGQYRRIVAALLACSAATVISLWLVCPDLAVSWRDTQMGIARFRADYMLQFVNLGFDHSFFALLKQILLAVQRIIDTHHPHLPSNAAPLASMLSIYLPVAATVGVLLYFVFIWKLPVLNQVLCLTVASIAFPPVSFDYTLIHLYVPWALLVLFAVESGKHHVKGLAAVFVCFAILLSPETEFILVQNHSAGGQIKAIALLVLFVLALLNRFPSSFDSTLEPNKLFAFRSR